MPVVDQLPTVAELMASTLAKYSTITNNDCEYYDITEEFIVNYVYSLFLKARPDASQEDNPNWREATRKWA